MRASPIDAAPRRTRVMWTGLRGFPGVQGGVETHAQEVCPRLHAMGVDVTVLARRCYQPPEVGPGWHGVRFDPVWAPRRKQLEAIVHTFLSVLYAGFVERPDVLHIQAIGPRPRLSPAGTRPGGPGPARAWCAAQRRAVRRTTMRPGPLRPGRRRSRSGMPAQTRSRPVRTAPHPALGH